MFPITRIRHRNAHTRKREERHELYTQQKKFKKIKWRERILREMRQKSNRSDQD